MAKMMLATNSISTYINFGLDDVYFNYNALYNIEYYECCNVITDSKKKSESLLRN
jgi:hypothetical protein